MKITINIFKDHEEVLNRILDEGVYRFGRSEFSDIVLDDKSVSRTHLELRVTENSVYLTNMSSGGKVLLNKKRLETSEVADGDEIKVGTFRIVVFRGERISESQLPPSADLVHSPENAQEPGAPAYNDLNNIGFESGAPPENAPGSPPPDNADQVLHGANSLFVQPDEPGLQQLQQDPIPNSSGTAISHAETQVEIKPIVAKLIFTEGPKAGTELFVETFEVTLGRSKKADIFLDDEKLSRFHAKVTRVGMGYRLIDMNSRNGTYVNGMRILEHPLSSFDEIQIGNTRIKFLIHDIMASEIQRSQLATIDRGSTAGAVPSIDQTKSLQIDALPREVLLELQRSGSGSPPPRYPHPGAEEEPIFVAPTRSRRTAILVAAVVMLAAAYYLIPSETPGPKQATTQEPVLDLAKDDLAAIKLPPSLPKEYSELTSEQQRQIEGYYNSAIQSAAQDLFEDSDENLRKIHSVLPFYKNSRELQDTYTKKLKEKRIADAQKKAKEDERQDLAIYLEEGLEYLKAADFEKAAESFNSAIVIDPTNETAIRGLKASEAKVTDLNAIPDEVNPEVDKRRLVAELFQKAVVSFTNRAYSDAINTAEKIRQIELKGDTQYLSEAKQIIDRARTLQKEEFEPFLIQAKEKYAEADYMASREMCEEMEKRDPSYDDAKECAYKAKRQLNRLAKEAYTYGYILESMNRIEEAKQYWNRAKNFAKKGDTYYDKIMRKLEYYQ